MQDKKRESVALQPVRISVVDQLHAALRMAIIGSVAQIA